MQVCVVWMKVEVLVNFVVGCWFDGMWECLCGVMLCVVCDFGIVLFGCFGESMIEFGNLLKGDVCFQFFVNCFVCCIIVGVVLCYGGEIVWLVLEIVKCWDVCIVIQCIEGVVGCDFQFICINGMLVGGLMGVVIYVVDMLL